LEARLELLLELLRERRGLLVLDNLEMVLEPELPDVRYRAGYEGYGEVLRRLGEGAHQGCLLVVSREQPLREDQIAICAMRLYGLELEDGRALLAHGDLTGDDAAWGALVARYAGNPLALRVVEKTAATVFDGDIAAFLAHEVAVFGDIRQLLDEQIGRLSVPERVVLRWLAEERKALGFAELVTSLGPMLGRAVVVEAVEALARRSLLEPSGCGTFTLQPVVLEYAITHLVECGGTPGQGGTVAGGGQGRHAAQHGAPGRAATGGALRRRRGQQGYGPVGTVNIPELRGSPRGYVPP
jgi:hypothetical protein